MNPSSILSVDQLSSLLGTCFTQAPQTCRYLVLELGGLKPEAIFHLTNADVYSADGSIDIMVNPLSHNSAFRAHLPALHQVWLLHLAGGKPQEKFISLPQAEVFHQLKQIQNQLGVEWTDANMRRTSFLLVLSHGMPCVECINALGFASSFPTRAGEREALPFGVWRRLLPQIVLSHPAP